MQRRNTVKSINNIMTEGFAADLQ